MSIESDNKAFLRKKSLAKNYLFLKKGKPKSKHYLIKDNEGDNKGEQKCQ